MARGGILQWRCLTGHWLRAFVTALAVIRGRLMVDKISDALRPAVRFMRRAGDHGGTRRMITVGELVIGDVSWVIMGAWDWTISTGQRPTTSGASAATDLLGMHLCSKRLRIDCVVVCGGVLGELPIHTSNLDGEHGDDKYEQGGGGYDERGFEVRILIILPARNIYENDAQKPNVEAPVSLDKFDEGDRLDLAQIGREAKVFGQVAVVDKLEADVVESHDLMQIPVAPGEGGVREPPLENAPQGAVVAVQAAPETAVLVLELEVVDEVHLLHALPALGEAQGDEHGDDDDESVEEGKDKDEDVGPLKGVDGGELGLAKGLVQNKDKGDETEDHELPVKIAQDGLQVDMMVGNPALQTMQQHLDEEREDNQEDKEPLGEGDGDFIPSGAGHGMHGSGRITGVGAQVWERLGERQTPP